MNKVDTVPILLCLSMIVIGAQALWNEFEFVSIENSKEGCLTTDLSIKKFNKTDYGITGTVDNHVDLTKYDFKVDAYHSARGNNQYKKLGFKLSRKTVCEYVDSGYFKTVEADVRARSDLPKRNSDEPFCVTLKPGTYHCKNYAFNPAIIPKHCETGIYKLELYTYETGSEDPCAAAILYIKLY